MKPRVVLVGVGRFGANHLRNLIELEQDGKISLNGVVDIDPKILARIKQRYKVPIDKRIDKFLSSTDAFVIVTPASTHYKLVKKCLMNRKHVFVEKPLALNTRQAIELAQLSQKYSKILAVGHIFRFNAAVQRLKKMLSGNLTTVYYLSASFLQDNPPRQDVGAMLNYLHIIDIIGYLLEKSPKSVFARITKKEKTNFESHAVILLKYPKGISALVNLGWIPAGKDRSLDVFTKHMHIRCDLQSQKIQINEQNRKPRIIVEKYKEPLKLELLNFLQSIRDNTKPVTDGFTAARIVKIAEAAKISALKNKVIQM